MNEKQLALVDYLNSLPPDVRAEAKKAAKTYAFSKDAALWAKLVLDVSLDPWQRELVATEQGRRVITLTHRQAGKTTGAAVVVAHQLIFGPPGSTSLVLAPTMRQSAEMVRRVRQFLLKANVKLSADNAFSLALPNNSRVIGLPGQDDAAIRGLTVDGVLCVDEAARVPDTLYQAATPMLLRHSKKARLMLLSTAWAKEGFFYKVWTDGDANDWMKIQARIEDCAHLTKDDIERERRSMPESVFRREYLCEFDQTDTRFFSLAGLANAFGDVIDATPELQADDPIIASARAFNVPNNEVRF